MLVSLNADDWEKITIHETSNTFPYLSIIPKELLLTSIQLSPQIIIHLNVPYRKLPTIASRILHFFYVAIWPQDINLRLPRFSCIYKQTCFCWLNLLKHLSESCKLMNYKEKKIELLCKNVLNVIKVSC